jgi:hypothetical protein
MPLLKLNKLYLCRWEPSLTQRLFLFFDTHSHFFCPLDCERVFCPPIGGEFMKVTDKIPEINFEKKSISQEQLQLEYDYIRAQRIIETLFDAGLISESEFDKITKLNRQSFTPALAQIMPEKRCY